jgi:hypothetical protein
MVLSALEALSEQTTTTPAALVAANQLVLYLNALAQQDTQPQATSRSLAELISKLPASTMLPIQQLPVTKGQEDINSLQHYMNTSTFGPAALIAAVRLLQQAPDFPSQSAHSWWGTWLRTYTALSVLSSPQDHASLVSILAALLDAGRLPAGLLAIAPPVAAHRDLRNVSSQGSLDGILFEMLLRQIPATRGDTRATLLGTAVRLAVNQRSPAVCLHQASRLKQAMLKGSGDAEAADATAILALNEYEAHLPLLLDAAEKQRAVLAENSRDTSSTSSSPSSSPAAAAGGATIQACQDHFMLMLLTLPGAQANNALLSASSNTGRNPNQHRQPALDSFPPSNVPFAADPEDLAQLLQRLQLVGQRGTVSFSDAKMLLVLCALMGVAPRPEVYSLLWSACEPHIQQVSQEELAEVLWSAGSLHRVSGWVSQDPTGLWPR